MTYLEWVTQQNTISSIINSKIMRWEIKYYNGLNQDFLEEKVNFYFKELKVKNYEEIINEY
ncbi:hypothetical protein THII_1647 [Thioploca ingrica]|uniref:Uncharacterized protein n=1 Tax=Thioploca ingrica TaxID=40754 RepID=A0A090AFT8_9GAMM|nr:hypothetical protein THII_1647 [Thioploca ingrica]